MQWLGVNMQQTCSSEKLLYGYNKPERGKGIYEPISYECVVAR